MKRLKLVLAWLLLLVMVLASIGCKNESGDDRVNYDVPGTVTLPEISDTTVIRNKVVNLNGSSDIYYEYLTFTSETGGTYSVYKSADEIKTKINTMPGTETPFPSEFEYDKLTGKFTAGTVSAYMLNARKNGTAVCAVASEILTTEADNKKTLLNTWKSKANESISFDNFGKAVFQSDGGNTGWFSYTNDEGWILIDGLLSLYWVNQGGSYNLYYKVYETERESVEDEGRSAASANIIKMTSSRFLLAAN